jgi:hypothetical protein
MARRCGAIALVALASACIPTIVANPGPAPGRASQIVDSTGATVSTDDGTSVVIPPLALKTPVTITIDLAPDAPLPSQATSVTTPHVFGPAETPFHYPVCLTLAFEPEILPKGFDEGSVVLYAAYPAGSSSYVELPTYAVDARHVMAMTSQFSMTVVAAYGGAREQVPDGGVPVCNGGPDGGDGGDGGPASEGGDGGDASADAGAE